MMSFAVFRFTAASTLSPLVSLELVGFAVFAEVPTWTTITGATFIVAAGSVLFRPEGKPRQHAN